MRNKTYYLLSTLWWTA